MKKYGEKAEQLEWSMVKEGENQKHVPAKRVDIVSLRLVKVSSLLYKDCSIRSPEVTNYVIFILEIQYGNWLGTEKRMVFQL